jgi:hypothetical protein
LQQHFPQLPVAWTFNTLECLCPDYFLELPEAGSLHAREITVALPVDVGAFRLDAVNPNSTDGGDGAWFLTGYASFPHPDESWRAGSGDVQEGTYRFVVIPEPAMWTFFVAAAVVLALRRRPAPKLIGHWLV